MNQIEPGVQYNYVYDEDEYMIQEEEWDRDLLLDPAWEKQQRKVSRRAVSPPPPRVRVPHVPCSPPRVLAAGRRARGGTSGDRHAARCPVRARVSDTRGRSERWSVVLSGSR